MLNSPYLRDRVIPALRSGEFTQQLHFLHLPNTKNFCALGVAVECARRDGLLTVDWEEMFPLGTPGPLSSLANIVGWGDTNGPALTINGRRYESIPHANDNECTFDEIAVALLHECDKQDAVTAAERIVASSATVPV